MLCPKHLVFLLLNEAKVFVCGLSKLKRKAVKESSENDHSQSEDVYFERVVGLGLLEEPMDLRSHVTSLGSFVGVGSEVPRILGASNGEAKV